MALDIVIVNYNSGHYLSDCLESLKSDVKIPCHRIVVYDNASSDNSLSDARRQFHKEVEYIENEVNIGFASAVNKGLKITGNEYILLVNPDMIVLPGTVYLMVDFLDQNPKCGIAGGEILSAQGAFQPTCRRFPNYYNMLFGRRSFFRRLIPGNAFSRSYLYSDLDYTKPQKIDFLEGSLMMLRRVALRDVGLLDEDFFMYLEDADLSYRMKKNGWETWWLPRAYGIHFRGETFRKDNIHPMIHHSRGFYKFFVKHYQPGSMIKFMINLLLVLRLGYVVSTESAKAYLK